MIEAVIEQTKVEPRLYQRELVGKTTSMYLGTYTNGADQVEPPVRSVLIESPTGSGKTVMGHLIARVLQEQNPEMVVAWTAMRRNLLSQAAVENQALGINVQNIHYVSMFDQSPSQLIAARKAGRDILVVVDEAQHDAANSMVHLHNIIRPDWILGLTATPFRTDKVKLCFERVVKDAGIHQLIQDGFLSKYHHYSIPEWSPEQVVEFYCRDPERWGKSIFYFLNLEQCMRAVALLQERQDEVLGRLRERRPDLSAKQLVEFVRGGQHKVTEDQLQRFRAGEVVCLVNCMVLTEGFDDPTLETTFVRDSSKGPTMQMAGRVFRMHPEWKQNGDERFQFKRVVQSKHTKWPILKTASAEQQYLWQHGEWRSLTINPHLQEINFRTRMAIARAEVVLPKWFEEQPKVRVRPWDRLG
jgi:superfamily II DNA or RNA helicase